MGGGAAGGPWPARSDGLRWHDERTDSVYESTLWIGEPHDYSHLGASNHLATSRQLLFDGKQKEAEALAMKDFMSVPLYQKPYQPFADLRRRFDRETLACAPAQVLVTRIAADLPGAFRWKTSRTRPRDKIAEGSKPTVIPSLPRSAT